MKRPVRHDDGMYHMDGKKFKELFGSRQQVWNGTAYKTPGGLRRKDLMMNKRRRIVSKKKYATAKREHRQKKRLFAKYTAKKGKFGAIALSGKKTRGKKQGKRGTKRGGEGLDAVEYGMKDMVAKMGFAGGNTPIKMGGDSTPRVVCA